MSSSTVLEWLDENTWRAYPLCESSNLVFHSGPVAFKPYATIVDASLAYSALPAVVKLERMMLHNDNLVLSVTGQSNFVYTLTNNEADYPMYARNAEGSVLVISVFAKDLYHQRSVNIGLTDVIFEPCVSYEIGSAALGVSQIKINNSELSSNQLSEGYQFSLVPDGQTIQIEAGRNEGNPLPCANFKNPGIDPDLYNTDCQRAVNSINGASPAINSGGAIKIKGGAHVKVYDDPDRHTIYIGLDFVAEDIADGKLLPV